MHAWKINEAKAKFSELIKAVEKEPQLIMNREKEVSVMINYAQFLEYQKLLESHKKPAISDFLAQLKKIDPPKKDFPITKRKDRKEWTTE